MKDREKTLTDRGIENQVEGKIDRLKGRAKDAWGSATGDKSLEAEGKLDRIKGRVQDEFGEAQVDLDEPNRVDPNRNRR